jgi:predicted kinase
MKKTIEILVGIPNSGKTTYSLPLCKDNKYIDRISRDDIRLAVYGKDYKPDKFKEENITFVQECKMDVYLNKTSIRRVIIDNTHCKEKYIHNIIAKYGNDYIIKIKFFDIPLWKAHYRNVIRRFKEGKHKWIPVRTLNQFYKNYKKIDKTKYAQYM